MMITEEWNDKPTGSSDERADLSSPLGAVADWSDLPKDLYVISVRSDGILFDVTMCNVPVAIGPEVRYSQAPTHAALLAHAMRLPEVAALVCAINGLLEWDKARNFIVPYRVRDPLVAALTALEASHE